MTKNIVVYKRIVLVVGILMALCLVSCNSDEEKSVNTEGTTIGNEILESTTEEKNTEETTTEEATTEAETETPTNDVEEVNPDDTEGSGYILPVVSINTDAEVLNKIDYVTGNMTIAGEEYSLRIKGRGNSSWKFPKKSYRLKLDKKSKILGMNSDKDWVLVSAYCDKSLIRNCIAMDMSMALDGLEYTAKHVLVDFYFNGEYQGVYTLAEKIEEGKSKVNLSAEEGNEPMDPADVGFLLEYGWDFDKENEYNKDYFDTKHTIRLFVKEPEMEVANTPEMKYIKKYIHQMEAEIVAGGNYENYIDMDSWVDWFILTELANNTESSFYRSCYLYKKIGGKVYLGPVWDFDVSFGNFSGDIQTYDKWCTGESTYKYTDDETLMIYLVKDKKFMSAVKLRWNEVKEELLDTALKAVDKYEAQVQISQVENFKKWNIMNRYVGAGTVSIRKYNTHELQCEYIREFLNMRYQWMDNELNTKW